MIIIQKKRMQFKIYYKLQNFYKIYFILARIDFLVK